MIDNSKFQLIMNNLTPQEKKMVMESFAISEFFRLFAIDAISDIEVIENLKTLYKENYKQHISSSEKIL